jgi:hypothetical protein
MIHNREELEEMFEDVGGGFFTVDTISSNLLNYYSKESINDFIDLEEL